jgi:hypothetical protein
MNHDNTSRYVDIGDIVGLVCPLALSYRFQDDEG